MGCAGCACVGSEEVVACGGEVEVFLGYAAGVVGGEGQGDLVVSDEDVGVVVAILGERGDLIDEGASKRAAVERAMDKVRGKFGGDAVELGLTFGTRRSPKPPDKSDQK